MLNLMAHLDIDRMERRSLSRAAELGRFQTFLAQRREAGRSAIRAIGWHGITGRGKSTLRQLLEKDLQARLQDGQSVAYASLSLAECGDLDSVLSIRAQLAHRSRIRFPAFDWAFIRWFQIAHPDADIRQRHGNLFTRTPAKDMHAEGQVSDEILSWMSDIGKDLLGTSLDVGLSLVPSLKLFDATARKGWRKLDAWFQHKAIRDQLRYLETLGNDELRSVLPHLLAFDLARSHAEKRSPDLLVLVLDDAELARARRVVNLPDHSWIEALIANTPGLDAVLLSQQPVALPHLRQVAVDWQELPRFGEEDIRAFLDAWGLDPFNAIEAVHAHGEPLFARLFAEEYGYRDFDSGPRPGLDPTDDVRRNYARQVLAGETPEDVRRLALATFLNEPNRDEYCKAAEHVFGRGAALDWDRLASKPYVRSENGHIDLDQPLWASLQVLFRDTERDLRLAVRDYLASTLRSIRTEGSVGQDTFRPVLVLLKVLDWTDPSSVPLLREVYERHFRTGDFGTVRDLLDEIRREFRKAPGDAERDRDLAAFEHVALWEQFRRLGDHDEACEQAEGLVKIINSRSQRRPGDLMEPIAMMADSVIAGAADARPVARSVMNQQVRGLTGLIERYLWLQLEQRSAALFLAAARNEDPARARALADLDVLTPGARSSIQAIIQGQQLSRLPTLLEEVQRIAQAMEAARSAARGNWLALQGLLWDKDNLIDTLRAFAGLLAQTGRRLCALEDYREIGRGYLKLALELSYQLGTALDDLSVRALAILSEANEAKGPGIREGMVRVEFEGELAESVPDSRRAGRLVATLVDACHERGDWVEVIALCRRFEALVEGWVQRANRDDVAVIYAAYATALFRSGRLEEARWNCAFARQALDGLGPIYVRQPREHQLGQTIRRVVQLERDLGADTPPS
ncbi:hypothetical protein FHG66_20320 [Rubellimicrobium rubrum]|uniref:Uncharacterized protein n=1 Tax=Rubellimicrobium rubrum TaxID=2585369 RepID=A0A5C4MMT5_9RHOB|nr:hypothetical protein [Rubellimicrobium rubrum]TNC45141.1 hypothetical protein FHG66_20320 [Rubellimicrobium rubrum]